MYTPQPLSPAGFELAPGNRLDFDVSIPADSARRDIEIVDRFTRRPFRLALIRVAGEPVTAQTFPSPAASRVPAWREAEAVPATHVFALNAQRGGPFGIAWTLSGEVYANHAQHQGVPLPLGRFVRLRFTNESSLLHPMHIHGMFFKVLARNGAVVDEPFWRDTALVHPKETLDVGLVPLDRGEWMLHCHVLEHAEAGMMTTVRVGGRPK